jgi:hypothetical protein
MVRHARFRRHGGGVAGPLRQPHPFACAQVPGPLPASGAVALGDFWIYAG